ncbi:MAG: hypothetical protein OQL08_12505 [Gammaproteobacteria bacterium]|nr:hypothetical protein [Gammaproteobacteria bacterium]
MALMKCIDCDSEISDKADSCPKCGAPVTKIEVDISKPSDNISIWVFAASVVFPFIAPTIYSFRNVSKRKKVQSWACSVGFIVLIVFVGNQEQSQQVNIAQPAPLSADNNLDAWAQASQKNKNILCSLMVNKINVNIPPNELCSCISETSKGDVRNISIAEVAASCAVLIGGA